MNHDDLPKNTGLWTVYRLVCITRSPHAVGVLLPCYFWPQKLNRRIKSASKFTNEWVYIIEKKQCLSTVLRLVKIGYLKVISSNSFLFRGYVVPVNAASKLHSSRLANQKRRHKFLRLWGIQTRYCAPISRRSMYHFSWVLQPSQRKLKTIILTQNFGGQKGTLWEMCEWRVLFRPRFKTGLAFAWL